MNRFLFKADDLNDYLIPGDKKNIAFLEELYGKAMEYFPILEKGENKDIEEKLIKIFNEINTAIKDIVSQEERLHVYSIDAMESGKSHVSGLIAKLRDLKTENREFIYCIQRAYEILFSYVFNESNSQKDHLFIKTPVNTPVQNYAVHEISLPNKKIANSVMCVMLRAALLPSMIFSREIEENTTGNYITPFALFKIQRNDLKQEHNMEYMLDLENSCFIPDELDGRDLVFADPMNATGGSLVTVIKYLNEIGVKPASITFVNVISAMKGSLNILRALNNCNVYTLWMDPVLNENAYIMPGLGDAGDRINGKEDGSPRDILQLMAAYDPYIHNLYHNQYQKIKDSFINKRKGK